MAEQKKYYMLLQPLELTAKYSSTKTKSSSNEYQSLNKPFEHLFLAGTMMREEFKSLKGYNIVKILVTSDSKKPKNLLASLFVVPHDCIGNRGSMSDECFFVYLDFDIASMLIAVAPEKRVAVFQNNKLLDFALTVPYLCDEQSAENFDLVVCLSSDSTREMFDIRKKKVEWEDSLPETVFIAMRINGLVDREVKLDELEFLPRSMLTQSTKKGPVDETNKAAEPGWTAVKTAATKKQQEEAAELAQSSVGNIKKDEKKADQSNAGQTKTNDFQLATKYGQAIHVPQRPAVPPRPNVQNLRARDCQSCCPIALDENETLQVVTGDRVVWFSDGREEEQSGTIKWLGRIFCDAKESHCRAGCIIAGVECDEPIGSGDGIFYGFRLFKTSPNHALMLLLESLVLASSLDTENSQDGSNQATGLNAESEVVPGLLLPPLGVDKVLAICGRRHGIQGNYNSCYLDATLFALFSFTNVFDYLLEDKGTSREQEVCEEVRSVIRETIVNPLRKSFYVSASRTMKLREIFDVYQIMPGATKEEKDPEEFIKKLFETVFRNEPFIKLNSGQAESIQQLFVTHTKAVLKGCDMVTEKNGQQRMAQHEFVTLRRILLVAFAESNIKFAEAPRCLILQLPRSGTRVQLFERTIPQLKLNISDLVENVPRICVGCTMLGQIECLDCVLDPTGKFRGCKFCSRCDEKVHSKRPKHQRKQIKCFEEHKHLLDTQSKLLHTVSASASRSSLVSDSSQSSTDTEGLNPGLAVQNKAAPHENSNAGAACSNTNGDLSEDRDLESRLKSLKEILHLYAIICIERSHYVCFVRSNIHDPKAPWVLFDSMADRVDQRGGSFNVPEITYLPNLSQQLCELQKLSRNLKRKNLDKDQEIRLKARRNELMQDKQIKRLLHDCYVVVYLNADHAPINYDPDSGLRSTQL